MDVVEDIRKNGLFKHFLIFYIKTGFFELKNTQRKIILAKDRQYRRDEMKNLLNEMVKRR
jgi:hypothetical protein